VVVTGVVVFLAVAMLLPHGTVCSASRTPTSADGGNIGSRPDGRP
jgi:hypothetical protein